MEELVAALAEKTIIGAAFIYLLYYFVNRFAASLLIITETMKEISNTLNRIDVRLDKLESRVSDLEVKN